MHVKVDLWFCILEIRFSILPLFTNQTARSQDVSSEPAFRDLRTASSSEYVSTQAVKEAVMCSTVISRSL